MPLSFSIVIVPVNFAGESTPASRTGLNAVDDASRLHLVHGLLCLGPMSPEALLGDFSDESLKDKVAENLGNLTGNTATAAPCAVLFGTLGLKIMYYAKRQKADLIVVPSHGFHRMKRFAPGSVSECVIPHTRCSVLVPRGGDAE